MAFSNKTAIAIEMGMRQRYDVLLLFTIAMDVGYVWVGVKNPVRSGPITNRLGWKVYYKLCPFKFCNCGIPGWCQRWRHSDIIMTWWLMWNGNMENDVSIGKWHGRWHGDDVDLTSFLTSYRNRHWDEAWIF